MSKNKKKIIIIGTILLIVALIYLLIKTGTTPTTPTPTPIPERESLNLTQVLPPEGKNETIFSSTGIQFTFDAPLDISSAIVTVEPSIDYVLDPGRGDRYTLVVRPVNEWKMDTVYIITIKNGLLSSNNKELKEDINHSFEFEAATDIIHY